MYQVPELDHPQTPFHQQQIDATVFFLLDYQKQLKFHSRAFSNVSHTHTPIPNAAAAAMPGGMKFLEWESFCVRALTELERKNRLRKTDYISEML